MGPHYGESEHYRGAAGEKYYRWQSQNNKINGIINARKFSDHIQPQDCVLDFGAGGGQMLASLNCRRRIAVDANPVARQAAQALGLECFEALELVEDSSVDVIVSNHALEHVPRPIDALLGMRQKLKAGGALVLVVPVDDWRTQKTFKSIDINHHLYTWTPQLLGNTLHEGGFEVSSSDIRIMTHAWFPGYARAFHYLPTPIFDLMCMAYSVVVKRRQLIAVVRKK